MFPPLSPWNGMHVQVIHFPIALLIVAPIFVILALAIPRLRQGLSLAALLLMLMGSAGAFLAVATGEAAAGLALSNPQVSGLPGIREAIEHHGNLAEWVRTLFAILTLLYAALIYLPGALKKPLVPKLARIFHAVFLIGYGLALLVLVNAAHHGGLLVHHDGLRANLAVSETMTHTD